MTETVPLRHGLTAHYITHADIAARRRGHQCGQRTLSGTVCRTRVAQAGDMCQWHRTEVAE